MTTTFAGHLLEGDHASRPAFSAVPEGTLYACSDHGLIYQSDGVAAWSTWATLGGDVATHLSDITDAHDASAISILDAASDFTATEVEGALAELQTADEADEAALAAHIADATDAHDASAVSVLDTGGLLTATDVEAALAEIAAASAAVHIADGIDAHDASAISFTPAGTIAATDVQAAIVEVAAEAGGGGGAGASDDLKQRANGYVLELDWTAGRYQDGGPSYPRPTGSGMAANTIYFTPLYVPKAVTVDRIGFNCVSGAAAGKGVRLGIYESGADGMPGALLLDAGTVAATSNGGKEITISQALAADTMYWLAYFTDATGGLSPLAHDESASPSFSLQLLTSTNVHCVVYRALAYAALPDPAGTVVTNSRAGNGSAPSIRVRVT